jgi:hypothetical protein
MDTSSFVDMGILMEYTDDRAIPCLEYTTGCDNGHITNLVIIYALDVYSAVW